MKCVFYTYHTSQFWLATFHEFNNHMWLVVAILHSAGRVFMERKEGGKE